MLGLFCQEKGYFGKKHIFILVFFTLFKYNYILRETKIMELTKNFTELNSNEMEQIDGGFAILIGSLVITGSAIAKGAAAIGVAYGAGVAIGTAIGHATK